MSKLEHSFSIEVKSKKYVRNISISDEDYNRVFFEGFLGELKELSHVEGRMLEIKCTHGVLRIDLNEEELRIIRPDSSLSSSEVGSLTNTKKK